MAKAFRLQTLSQSLSAHTVLLRSATLDRLESSMQRRRRSSLLKAKHSSNQRWSNWMLALTRMKSQLGKNRSLRVTTRKTNSLSRASQAKRSQFPRAIRSLVQASLRTLRSPITTQRTSTSPWVRVRTSKTLQERMPKPLQRWTSSKKSQSMTVKASLMPALATRSQAARPLQARLSLLSAPFQVKMSHIESLFSQ